MAEREKFLLRISEDLYAALEKWAADDLRSVNAQVEYLLTEAARKTGHLKPASIGKDNPAPATADSADN